MEVIGIFDAGTGTIQTPHGKKNVGFVNIRVSDREAAPVDNLYWYELHRKESLFKAIRSIHPIKRKEDADA